MRISIIIRTYNEEKYLGLLLDGIHKQQCVQENVEIIVVDSGSTDDTVKIANSHDCIVVYINKNEFTFGRSLNVGCEAANGEILVFVSGHCIPVGQLWLQNLVKPLLIKDSEYVYGRQVGNGKSKFSECQLFKKYYPDDSTDVKQGYFCNNANAAILKKVWNQHRYNEELTGLEDMELAKRLVMMGMKIGYVAEATIYHIHEETWQKIKIRYEREAIALHRIMPEVQITFRDFLRYFSSGVLLDFRVAVQEKVFFERFFEIIMFRMMQYWGTYRGNRQTRKLSRKMKEAYFYPR